MLLLLCAVRKRASVHLRRGNQVRIRKEGVSLFFCLSLRLLLEVTNMIGALTVFIDSLHKQLRCLYFPECEINMGQKIRRESRMTNPFEQPVKYVVKRDARRKGSDFKAYFSDEDNTTLLEISFKKYSMSVNVPIPLHDRWSNISFAVANATLTVSGTSGDISWDVGVASAGRLENASRLRIETLEGNYLIFNQCPKGVYFFDLSYHHVN